MADSKDSAWEAFVENLKTTNFKLPHQRIWNIMKSDEDVRMISHETTVLMAKACELFIFDLTHRAWQIAAADGRTTLTHEDITAAIEQEETFDFLREIPASSRLKTGTANAAAAAATAMDAGPVQSAAPVPNPPSGSSAEPFPTYSPLAGASNTTQKW